MGIVLREPLIHVTEGEDPAVFWVRAIAAAADHARVRGKYTSGRLRLEIGTAFAFGDRVRSYNAASLWVECGTGRTESWQRVTPTLVADSYQELFELLAKAWPTVYPGVIA